MIVVEEKLAELFNLLPPFPDTNGNMVKPVYHFGDGIEANEFIKKRNRAVYPLIYQNLTEETQNIKANTVSTRLEIVLCVKTRTEMLNTERWATTYRDVLMPLLNNIGILFTKSNIILSNLEFDIAKFPNYSETESKQKNAFIDIVDAIRVRVPITIDGNLCLPKQILFPNVPVPTDPEDPDTDPPTGDCSGVLNFTGFTVSGGNDFTKTINFTGGNLLGSTEVIIVGVSTVTLPVGISSVSVGLNLGTYTIRWRKICGGQPVTPYSEGNYEVINEGVFGVRLATVNPFNENDVQFPCFVAYTQTSLNTNDNKQNSGLIANDENEYIEIWNDVNSHLGVMHSPMFEDFGFIKYWSFKITMNDYVHRPQFAWSYLVE